MHQLYLLFDDLLTVLGMLHFLLWTEETDTAMLPQGRSDDIIA
jgi:hypothetical protein